MYASCYRRRRTQLPSSPYVDSSCDEGDHQQQSNRSHVYGGCLTCMIHRLLELQELQMHHAQV